ncbi:MAG TPA: hypothetical protein VJ596_11300 [Gemmatimonadaceae bacterium]|nr:hypothetical protein [Gemmatimonadaceae bacterium]
MRGSPAWLLVALTISACSAASRRSSGAGETVRPAGHPVTRAERTRYGETSSHQDVIASLDSLQSLGAPLFVGSIGRSMEGRELPLVVLRAHGVVVERLTHEWTARVESCDRRTALPGPSRGSAQRTLDA